MQVFETAVLLSNIASLSISILLSTYLFRLWYRQEARLATDLPLVFSLSFVGQSVNMSIVSLADLGILEMTLELFKFRTFFISFAVIPVLGAILNIWLPRLEKHHNRIIVLFALFWLGTTILSPSDTLIMALLIPLLVVTGIVLMATFFITWRTGRLQEIRSDLMVVGILVSLVGQASKVSLLMTSLFYIPDVLLAIGMIIVSIAITNPWFKPGVSKEEPVPVAPPVISA